MFLKKKLDSRGNFIKWKARYVAGGHRQSQDATVIRYSHTVHHNSFLITALKAADEGSENASVDVTGAYLLVEMTTPVPRILANSLVSLDPSYAGYLQPNGDIIVKLDKALYGCVESARLWYNEVFNHLKSQLFTQSEVDPMTTIVIVYVDDFLITAKTIRSTL
jgi:hypothetical protein